MKKTYRVGIIGCGGISHMHTKWYLAEERTEVVAISVSILIAAAYSQQYDIEKLILISSSCWSNQIWILLVFVLVLNFMHRWSLK